MKIHLLLFLLAEYMPGGSLYDYLHKNHNVLKLSELLKFAIDVCKGMEYLHHNNIIHRDLKTANLLMDTNNVRTKGYCFACFAASLMNKCTMVKVLLICK